jgi:acetyl-CoA C-acetyltransferase
MSDEALTIAIRGVLSASPFHGEGHRKLWARLRHAGTRTSLRRVLRLMRQNNLLAPTRVYPLFENRLQADLGLTPAQAAAESARLYAAQSVVAARHPAAWQPRVLSPEEVGAVGPGNRMVCEPYPLSMNAMPHVDQAAAVVLTSRRAALELGIPEAQLVHVWGGAGADDTSDVLGRPGFGRSLALECALSRCLEAGGVDAADLDLVDVYSCFPIVPKLVAGQLGLPRDSALTVTGGHSSFGGPLNSFEIMQAYIDSGDAGVHFEDQLAS